MPIFSPYTIRVINKMWTRFTVHCSTHGMKDNPMLNIYVERIYVGQQMQPSVSPYDRGSTLYNHTEFGELLAHSIIYVYIHIIHFVVCLTTGPKPLSKPVPHRERSSVSAFNLQTPLFSLRSSSCCIRLPHRLPAISVLPSIFLSVTCFRKQFLLKM